MKRTGYLIEKVIAQANLNNAFDCVMKGKRRNRTVRHYLRNREKILAQIAGEIEGDTYRPKGFYSFTVVEHGKERNIQSLPFRDRIALHAIMSVLNELFKPMLVRDTYASIAGRGIHDGLFRVRKALRDRQGTRYCLKLDLQKFYPSVIGALWGWAKHANSKTLLKKLLGMKDFKELGLKHRPKDGKKRFDVDLVPLGSLTNCEIIVHDFETDIKTKMGEGRYVIEFEMDDKRKKFMTDSEEMKDILDQVKEVGELPFRTTIKRVPYGNGKVKYTFT